MALSLTGAPISPSFVLALPARAEMSRPSDFGYDVPDEFCTGVSISGVLC